jgi:hypothetical protein
MNNDKRRQPDHFIQVVTKDERGKKKYRDIGELWDGKDGYSSGDSILGSVVIQSREAREQLQKMRAEKAQKQEAAPELSLQPKP